ncbi:MAG TPA: PqqD family protein [Ilumatobacteraceae bacterium]|nr:PqqD family protein [Ilumatobacteraceae bacterium]
MTTRWSRTAGVTSRAALGQVVLLAPGSIDPIAIVAPADELWELLQQPRTLDELVTELADGADETLVRDALAAVLQRMAAAGVISPDANAS